MLAYEAYLERSVPLPDLLPTPPNVSDPDSIGNHSLPDPMALIAQGAMVIHSNSAGKDSQALLIHLVERLHIPPEQITSIHADLGPAEWEGVEEHARSIAEAYGVRFLTTHAVDKHGNRKELLDYMDKRGLFPSKGQRWCTSDWKRTPIRRAINQIRAQMDHPSPWVLNTMGMRSQESIERAQLDPLEYSQEASCPNLLWPVCLDRPTKGNERHTFDWHPILHYTEEQVFATIAAANQTPHWAYSVGARRLSCLACIFSSEDDLISAARHSEKGRSYLRKIIHLEDKHDHTLLPVRAATRTRPAEKRYIRDIVGDLLVA